MYFATRWSRPASSSAPIGRTGQSEARFPLNAEPGQKITAGSIFSLIGLQVELGAALRVENDPSLTPVVNHHRIVKVSAEQVVRILRYTSLVQKPLE